MQPVPIRSIGLSPRKLEDKVISVYCDKKKDDSDFSIIKEKDLIISLKNINGNKLPLISKNLILTEDDVYQVSYLEMDSFYLYARYLDEARIQYFLEIGREFNTEGIVLVSNEKDISKAMLTDAKIIGFTGRDFNNKKLTDASDRIMVFEKLLDLKPELILVYDFV